MINIYEAQRANKLKSAIIIIVFAVFVALAVYILAQASSIYLGFEPGGLGFVGFALIISGIISFIGYYFSDKIVLGISQARPADRKRDFNFYTVCENLAIASGIPKPSLYVIEDSAPNAFATGRDPNHAVVCATTGLLSKLTRTELEGVIAHELSHIKNYDSRLMSVVAVMVGMVALLADWFLRMSWHGTRAGDDDKGQLGTVFLILGFVIALLSPLISQLIQLAISRRREFMADAGSVAITRQPQGLIDALQKIALDVEPLEAANKATAHLYIINPFKGVNDPERTRPEWNRRSRGVDRFAGLFNTHPPVNERIKILKNMI